MFIQLTQVDDSIVTIQASEIAAFRRCAIDPETEIHLKGSPSMDCAYEVRESCDEVAWLIQKAIGSTGCHFWSLADKRESEAADARREILAVQELVRTSAYNHLRDARADAPGMDMEIADWLDMALCHTEEELEEAEGKHVESYSERERAQLRIDLAGIRMAINDHARAIGGDAS